MLFTWIKGSMDITVYVDGCFCSFDGRVVSRDDTELILSDNHGNMILIQLAKIIAVKYKE